MDIVLDGCPWGLEPGWPLAEEPVCQEGDWDNLLSELLCDTGEGSPAELQGVGSGLVPGAYVAGQSDVDPSATAASDRSNAGDGDHWRSSIMGDTCGAFPLPDVLTVDGEQPAVKAAINISLPDSVPQYDCMFPLCSPQLVVEGVEVEVSNLSPSDVSETTVPNAARLEESVSNRKRSRNSSEGLPSPAVKISRRAHQAESVGGTEAQPLRSGRSNGAGEVDGVAEIMDCLASDSAATPESGADDVLRKRQQRLMRNRESASQSRSRKKSYLKELEMKCRYLEGHCTKLQHAVHHTSMENLALREELERAKKSNGNVCSQAEPAALESDSLPSESLPRRTYLFLTANLLLSCLIFGLCHESLGRVVLAMLLRAAPRGENDRVGTFPTVGDGVVGRNELLRPPRDSMASSSSRKKRRRRKGLYSRSLIKALRLQRQEFPNLEMEDILGGLAVRKPKQIQNSTIFRCRVKCCRVKRRNWFGLGS